MVNNSCFGIFVYKFVCSTMSSKLLCSNSFTQTVKLMNHYSLKCYRSLSTYLNIRGHICKCNHYVLEVGNKSHVCSRGGHKESPYEPPWAQFRKIFHYIPVDICRCIRLFHPCTYHHSAQRIQIGYR